jgi:hypothetical protein
MKRKILTGVMLVVVTAVSLLFAPTLVKTLATPVSDYWGEWQYGQCVAGASCGTTEGTIAGTRNYYHYVEKTCDYSCPVVKFSWKTTELDVAGHYEYHAKDTVDVAGHYVCGNGYTIYQTSKCKKDNNPRKGEIIDATWVPNTYKCPSGYENNPGKSDCRKWIPDTFKTVFHNVDVAYEKSNDPLKCHRPSDDTLKDTYGMNNSAKNDFKSENSEWKDSIESNCVDAHWEITNTENDSFSCTVPLVECVVDACPNLEGHQSDKKECPDTTPSVTPSVTPDVTITPEPSATPIVTQAPKQENKSSGGDTGWHAPGPTDYSCHNTKPEKRVANFHLYRKGDSAKLYWQSAGQNAPTVNVYYKLVKSSSWEHSVINWPNDGYLEIRGLGSRDWTFAIAQNNGCIEGDQSSPIVDGNTNGWILFR